MNQALKKIKREATTALNDEARLWRQYNQNIVSQWRGKPQFVTFTQATRDGITVTMFYRGQYADRWIWTDRGTEPHVIRPRGEGYPLRFQRNYSAYTEPIARSGIGDGSRSGAWVSVYEVNHPGTTPREFTDEYAKRNQDRIIARVQRKIKRALE